MVTIAENVNSYVHELKVLEVYSLLSSVLPTSTGIYRILNLLTGKYYIGSARAKTGYKGFRGRFYYHRTQLVKNCHHSNYLQNAFNLAIQDGLNPDEVFQIQIIQYVQPELCIQVEDWYLKYYKPEYNGKLNAGGGSYEMTDVTRARMSKASKGREKSPETCKKLSESHKKRYAEFGISDETRAKMSKARKNRVIPPEVGAKISKALKGRKRTDEHTEKIAQKNRRSYLAITPDGELIRFEGGKKFARENGIYAKALFECVNHKKENWRGWQFYDINDPIAIEIMARQAQNL